MSNLICFYKKYRTEIMVVLILLCLPIIQPIFEIMVKTLFTAGNAVGSWVRVVSETGFICH